MPYLQKWQSNPLFEAIQNAGLDPSAFLFKNEEMAARIQHRSSESYFVMEGSYVGSYVVGDSSVTAYEAYDFQNLIARVSRWAEQVKRDIGTPDLWARLQGDATLLGSVSSDVKDNTPFTAEERKDIEKRLRELEARLKETVSLSGPEIEILNTNIDYLVEAAGRLGRIDWRNIFVGVAVSYVAPLVLPPESVPAVFHTFVEVLRAISYFYGSPQLPFGTC